MIVGAPKTLPGRLTISRLSGGDNEDAIRFELVDEIGGCIVANGQVLPADFALAVTGLGRVPCIFAVYDAPIGKERQIKDELVFVPHRALRQRLPGSVAAELLAPFEVNGWKGSTADLWNRHHLDSYGVTRDGVVGDLMRVGFVRWVANPSTVLHAGTMKP